MVTMYSLVFTELAKGQYENLNARLKGQVDKGLARISKNPKMGKPLRGDLKGIWSERVATFRILYKIQEADIEILILVVEHRRSVYGGH